MTTGQGHAADAARRGVPRASAPHHTPQYRHATPRPPASAPRAITLAHVTHMSRSHTVAPCSPGLRASQGRAHPPAQGSISSNDLMNFYNTSLIPPRDSTLTALVRNSPAACRSMAMSRDQQITPAKRRAYRPDLINRSRAPPPML